MAARQSCIVGLADLLGIDAQRRYEAGQLGLHGLTGHAVRHHPLDLKEYAQAVELIHAECHVAEAAGTPHLDDPDGRAEPHRDYRTVHLITVRDSRLMLLARQNVLSWALQREDMSAANGTQAGKGHPAPVVAIRPAIRRVRLIVLAEGYAQLDTTHFQRREKRPEVPDPVLDLDLAHRASLWTLKHRSPPAVTLSRPT